MEWAMVILRKEGIGACRRPIVGHRVDRMRTGAITDMTCIKNRGNAKPGAHASSATPGKFDAGQILSNGLGQAQR
jgi:hypothetical protein